jgi:formate dehydrogenase maturation protein FdhE
MSSPLPLDVIKPELIKAEMNIIKLSMDIEEYPAKKWNEILDKLIQNRNKISKEEIQIILEQIVKAQRCEFLKSKRILKVYEQEVRINTHFI